MNQLEIEKFLLNEPLIIKDDGLFSNSFMNIQGTNIFFGVGLATDKEVSVGIPFDILGMILTAERMRSKLSFDKVIIQIADEHAISNSFVNKSKIQLSANSLKRRLDRMMERFGFDNFEIVLSSETSKFEIKEELSNIQLDRELSKLLQNKYFFLELVDIEFFRRFHNVSTKISWMIPGTVSNGHDERFFDSKFESVWGQNINFINLQPGFTFEKNNWRTSPYIHKEGQNRILIDRDELVIDKFQKAEQEWNDTNMIGTKKHLQDIVRLFETMFGRIGNLSLEEKIVKIIRTIV
jgi:hypothetical protein